MLAAGPFEGGGGIFIFNTENIEEAKQWLSSDPGVQARRWNIEILSYTPHIGGVCPVGEKYEMITYTFIRYRQKRNNGPAILNHENHLETLIKSDNIISRGVFEQPGEEMLVLKDSVDLVKLQSDPAIEDGTLELELKKLFIAKGSFCEQK